MFGADDGQCNRDIVRFTELRRTVEFSSQDATNRAKRGSEFVLEGELTPAVPQIQTLQPGERQAKESQGQTPPPDCALLGYQTRLRLHQFPIFRRL